MPASWSSSGMRARISSMSPPMNLSRSLRRSSTTRPVWLSTCMPGPSSRPLIGRSDDGIETRRHRSRPHPHNRARQLAGVLGQPASRARSPPSPPFTDGHAHSTLDRITHVVLYEHPSYTDGIDRAGIQRLDVEIEQGPASALLDSLLVAGAARAPIRLLSWARGAVTRPRRARTRRQLGPARCDVPRSAVDGAVHDGPGNNGDPHAVAAALRTFST